MKNSVQRMKVWGERVLNNIYVTIIVLLADFIALCLLFLTWLGVSFNKEFLISILQNVAFDLVALVVAILLVDGLRDVNRKQKLQNINHLPVHMLKYDLNQAASDILRFLQKEDEAGHDVFTYLKENKGKILEDFKKDIYNMEDKEEVARNIINVGIKIENEVGEDIKSIYPMPHSTMYKAHFLLRHINKNNEKLETIINRKTIFEGVEERDICESLTNTMSTMIDAILDAHNTSEDLESFSDL